MISASQCRAARALVDVSRDMLAERSGIDADRIAGFERKLLEPDSATVDALEGALEDLGALFLPENGGGIGVRLKFTRAEARRIQQLETDGGQTADDEVP